MSALYAKILQCGEAGNLDLVQDEVSSTNGEKLRAMMKSKLVDPQASRVLGYIFDSLSNSGTDESKRISLIECVLKEAPKYELTNQQNNALLMRSVIEVDRLSTPHLVQLTDYCLNQLQKEKADSTSWKELLPKLLYLLQGKGSVIHEGSEMTGPEYKSQVIHALCMTEWKPNIITMVADMFSDVPLSDEEKDQVTNKLYSGLASMEPSEVPPLVHQLLRVCGDRCCLTLLMHVQQYFASRLGIVATTDQDETDTINYASLLETKQSEGTVLFHVLHCASLGRPTIKLMLKTLRNLAQAPELIFGGPLLLPSALLMIASLSPYRDMVMNIMVTAVCQAVQDDEQRRQSKWVRELVPSQRNLQSLLENIVNETPVERGMVLERLVALCFELLRTKRQGRHERTAERIWSLGSSTLLYLIKRNQDALATVVEKLVENFTRPSKHVTQFVCCFQQVVALKRRDLLQNQQFLSFFLVDQLMIISPPVSEQAVLALVPMLQLCEPLCNSLVLVLRKSLNIPRVGIRQMAVTSLLIMMQKLKAKRMGTTLSQQPNSASSTSSQMSSDITVHGAGSSSVRNPEALCLELLHMLKHCFTFQAEVKLRLYQGMLELVSCNPEMSLPALQFLHTHLRRLRSHDPNLKCPLLMDTLYKSSLEEDAAILTEPLAHLLFAVTQVFVLVNQDEAKSKPWFPQIEREVQEIAQLYSQCSLHDLGFEEDELTLEEGEKGSRKQLRLGQALGMYEALIAFAIHTWSRDNDQGVTLSRRITCLFKGYSSVSDYSKSLKRPNKKKAADESQQGPVNPRKRVRPSPGPVASGSGMLRDNLKLPPVIDLGSLHLLLQLLYQPDVEWASEADAEHVKSRLELQCWVLRSIPIVMHHILSCSLNALMDKHAITFQQISDISQLLYQRCVCELAALHDESPDIALLATEAFHEVLTYMITNHRPLLPLYLTTTSGITSFNSANMDDAGWTAAVHQMTDRLTKLLHTELERTADQNEEDNKNSKLSRVLLSILSRLCDLLESDDRHLDTAQRLVQEVSRTQTSVDDGVVKGILDLLTTLHARRSGVSHPLTVITRHMCQLTGVIDDQELSVPHKNVAMVSEENCNVVILLVCSRIRETCEHLVLITQRLRCERRMLPYLVNADRDLVALEISQKERGLCNHASALIDVVVLLTSMAASVEVSDSILRLISALYRTLVTITRHFSYFSTRSHAAFRGANFEKLVRAAGRVLSGTVQAFITHVEGKQRERYEQQQTSKRFNVITAQRRIKRDSECISRTIFDMEKFSKTIIQLSAKTKSHLNEYLHLGVSHDFRINSHEVHRALATLRAQGESEDEGQESADSANESNSLNENQEEEDTHMDEA